LVSFLDEKGRPCITERAFVLPPGGQIGPITPDQRKVLIDGSLVAGVYEKMVDRESAYEKLKGRAADSGAAAAQGGRTMADEVSTAAHSGGGSTTGTAQPGAGGGMLDGLKDVLFGTTGPRGGKHEGLAESAARSAMRTIGSSVGREIVRGVLGSLLGGSRKR
jgi:DNA helicase HerA-like ATPase